MSYKTILVHVDAGARSAARIEIAIRLAGQFDAHLVALHALTRADLPAYLVAEAGISIVDKQKRLLATQASRAESAFRQAVSAAGWTKSEWRASAEDALDEVALHARYADLLVLGQPAEDDADVDRDFAERAVLSAGRPTLVIPYAGSFPTIGTRALVAWNGSREATRALTDAIPMLERSSVVYVMVFDADVRRHGDDPGADVALYLARHGIRVEVMRERAVDIDVGNKILSRAADLSIDLIVMGAYGHWRLREWVTGGVTRTLLDSMTVPTLMSH